MRYSTPSIILSAVTLFQLSASLPFEAQQQHVRRAPYSIVNVNGDSGSPATTVTETTSQFSTATVTTTALPSSDVVVAVIDVVQGSQTTTITVTATAEVFNPSETVTVNPTIGSSSADSPAATTTSFISKPSLPFGNPHHYSNSTHNSTIPHHNGTQTVCGCDKHNNGTVVTKGAAHSTGFFTAGSHVHLTHLPTLPTESPTWYNKTEIPQTDPDA